MAPATNIKPVLSDSQYITGLGLEFDRIKANPDYVFDNETPAIIMVGGGKYWPGMYVAVKMLQHVGYTGEIEIWNRGGVEQIHPEDLAGVNGVSFHSIPDYIGGWESKLYALYNTKRKKVFYLDADAYCVNNPDPLFNLLSEDNPFIYWQDLDSQQNSIKWKTVYPDGASRGIPPCQGGQILIDREYAWKTIHAAKYICDNSAYFFKRMYGDQDAWRVCLAGRTSRYLCLQRAEWNKVAFVCSHENIPYVVHRCKGKLYSPEYISTPLHANPHYSLPAEVHVFNYFAECLNKRELPATETFNYIYRKNAWGNVKQPSGAGSTIKEAMPLINYVDNLIESNGYTSLVDVGCGDGTVGNLIKVAKYTGYDCSDYVLQASKRKFKTRSYKLLDISSNPAIIEVADVLLCKDVLHHWPNAKVTAFLDYLLTAGKWKAIVLCFDIQQLQDNQDCHTGGYRALSVDMNPLKPYKLSYAKTFLHKGIITVLDPLAGFKCLNL